MPKNKGCKKIVTHRVKMNWVSEKVYFRHFLGTVQNGAILHFYSHLSFLPSREFRFLSVNANHAHRGLTLMELIIAVAMITIIFAAIVPQFAIMGGSWDKKQGAAEAIQNGRVLMDNISRNLSEAKRITAVSTSSIDFNDCNGLTWRYNIGANNYVKFGPPSNLSDLAGPVSSLTFTCYDACDLATPITDVNRIRVVKTDAVIVNPSSAANNKSFTTWSYLRVNAQNQGQGCWQDEDIGAVLAAGSAAFASDTWTVNGSGIDIWDYSDGFHYVYQSLSGDGQIVARVGRITNTNSWAKAGVMIRETLTGGSTHAMMVVTPGSGNAFQRRLSTGGISTHTAGSVVTAPYWVKLTRRGNTLTGYESQDGAAWNPVGSDTVSMVSSVYIGLCVTSHNDGALCTADFNNVSFLTYEGLNGYKDSSDLASLAVPIPAGTSQGDLLIAAVATDEDTSGSIIPPAGQGWTMINRGAYSGAVTLGAWWKNAGASEPVIHTFSWSGNQQAYGWMMRFTGHDAANPINALSYGGTTSSNPTSPEVTSTVSCCQILRLGAFNNDDIIIDTPGLANNSPITMDESASSSAGAVNYLTFGEGKRNTNSTSVVITAPASVSSGNLLIAAVVTDGSTSGSIAAPVGGGWTLLNRGSDSGNNMTLGIWWKIAGASEPANYTFTWTGNEQAYGWIMRFTGHDPAAPINVWQFQQGTSTSSTPPCPSVNTTVANTMIVRIGGFDLHAVTIDNPGLPGGYTSITMDESSATNNACSGGAGCIQQAVSGASGAVNFALTAARRYRTATIAIAPYAVTGTISGGAGYVRQATAGASGTSTTTFTLGSSNEARMLTIAIAPDSAKGDSCCGNQIRP
jgi:type II secretory pathway pseudopilin PulG